MFVAAFAFAASAAAAADFNLYGGYIQHQLFEGRKMYLEIGKIPVHECT